MHDRWAKYGEKILRHPVPVLLVLIGTAATIEYLQYLPEYVPGSEALGEIVRNLAYALFTALLFNWLVVEIPAQRRRRKSYDYCQQSVQFLLTVGLGLAKPYELNAKVVGMELDAWSEDSFAALADTLVDVAPAFFGSDRRKIIEHIVDTGLPRALAEIAPSVPYLDAEVAHALSQMPRQDGLTSVLQVRATETGGIEHRQDVHITWSLLEAARRLYTALLDNGAYNGSIIQGTLESTNGISFPLTDDFLIKPAQA